MSKINQSSILIIDQNENDLHFYTDLFLREGFKKSMGVATGKNISDILFAKTPDIVLLNIYMGTENAFKVLSDIQAADVYLPVVILADEEKRSLAERALRKGASAYIIKPLSEDKIVKHVKNVLDSSAIESVTTKGSIMVVDDEKEITSMLGGFLRSNGYDCLVVNNPKLAPALVKKHRPSLAFLDLMMPEMDGIALLEEIKVIEKKTRVIIVSGISDNEICINAIKRGACGYITKPFSLQQIKVSVIAALMQR